MAVRFGYLVQARNFAQTNTTASAFLFGATGQSAIMCGPESNYLKGDQRLVSNRPTIVLSLGQKYLIIGQKTSVKKLCEEKYDQLIKKAARPSTMWSKEAKADWGSLAIEIRFDKVEPKFSETFARMAASIATGPVPLLTEGLVEAGDCIGEKYSEEIMLTFCLSYGVSAARMEKQGLTKVFRTPLDEIRLAYVHAHIF